MADVVLIAGHLARRGSKASHHLRMAARALAEAEACETDGMPSWSAGFRARAGHHIDRAVAASGYVSAVREVRDGG
jgi:hypothetical protein